MIVRVCMEKHTLPLLPILQGQELLDDIPSFIIQVDNDIRNEISNLQLNISEALRVLNRYGEPAWAQQPKGRTSPPSYQPPY